MWQDQDTTKQSPSWLSEAAFFVADKRFTLKTMKLYGDLCEEFYRQHFTANDKLRKDLIAFFHEKIHITAYEIHANDLRALGLEEKFISVVSLYFKEYKIIYQMEINELRKIATDKSVKKKTEKARTNFIAFKFQKNCVNFDDPTKQNVTFTLNDTKILSSQGIGRKAKFKKQEDQVAVFAAEYQHLSQIELRHLLLHTTLKLGQACHEKSQSEGGGSTFVLSAIGKNTITTANVGDSYAIFIGSKNGVDSLYPLTYPQTPYDTDEIVRLAKKDVTIIDKKSKYNEIHCRVLSNDGKQNLACSRAFGDANFAVDFYPLITEFNFSNFDSGYLLLMSDGVPESLSHYEILNLYKESKNNLEKFPDNLRAQAFMKGSFDNITAMGCVINVNSCGIVLALADGHGNETIAKYATEQLENTFQATLQEMDAKNKKFETCNFSH